MKNVTPPAPPEWSLLTTLVMTGWVAIVVVALVLGFFLLLTELI